MTYFYYVVRYITRPAYRDVLDCSCRLLKAIYQVIYFRMLFVCLFILLLPIYTLCRRTESYSRLSGMPIPYTGISDSTFTYTAMTYDGLGVHHIFIESTHNLIVRVQYGVDSLSTLSVYRLHILNFVLLPVSSFMFSFVSF